MFVALKDAQLNTVKRQTVQVTGSQADSRYPERPSGFGNLWEKKRTIIFLTHWGQKR